ncbi:MAG: prepilin-type N-terminal cleavage/methylation domain-containing protein [Pirellulales bacterium]|nr:prepilin-type N-terminal cleavage/methylation domain-containing protein [Pirellulales bacterium]
MRHSVPSFAAGRQGLTLFELVIVLAILAAISVSASIATDRILARQRHQVTTQTLDSFRRSLLGRYGQTESASSIALANRPTFVDGFLADTGRLPIAMGNNPQTQLAELWQQPAGMSAYGVKVSASDSEVSLACGWRGSYLDLPIGAAALQDGWGRDLVVLSADGGGAPQTASDGDSIRGLTSLGSDGRMGVSTAEQPLAEDLTVWLGSAAMSSNLSVTVYESDGSGGRIAPSQAGSLMVRLYLPDAATGEVGFQQSSLLATPSATAPVFVFSDILIGPKVLRAYWVGSGSLSVQSVVTPIEVRRGGQTSWEIVLPPLPVST